jgi:hypothetical protein
MRALPKLNAGNELHKSMKCNGVRPSGSWPSRVTPSAVNGISPGSGPQVKLALAGDRVRLFQEAIVVCYVFAAVSSLH